MWNGRYWERADVELNHQIYYHVSWPRNDGVLLMGCRGSKEIMLSTELVTWDGKTSTAKFSLEYPLE